MFKTATIITALVISGLTLTGCTAGGTGVNDSTSKVQGDGKTYPTFTDFINDTLVKDEHGEYISTKINPNSKALVYDPSRTQPQFYNLGFTDTDGKEAQKFVAEFVAKEGLDSIALDDNAQLQKWVDEKFDTYMGGDYTGNMKKDILVTSEETYFPFMKGFPLTVRDSKPRLTSSVIHINSVDATENETGTYVIVSGDATAKYRATEKNVLANTVKANSEQKMDEGTVLAAYPSLKDGKPEVIDARFYFNYTVQKIDGKWKIVDYNNSRVWQVESMRQNGKTTAPVEVPEEATTPPAE